MDDLPAQLLRAALDYVLGRLRGMATPAKLKDAVDGALPPDTGPVAALIDAGLAKADEASALLAAGNIAGAAVATWDAVGQFFAAAALLGVDAGSAAQRAVEKQRPKALLSQLGLTAPTATASGSAVELAWTRRDVRVALFRVGTVRLVVALSGTGLRMSVRGGQVRIDLGQATAGVLRILIGAAGSAAADFELTVDHRGLTAGGSLGPIALPARLDAQVVELEGLELALEPGGPTMGLTVRSRLAVDIAGVIGARVDGSGVRLMLDATRILRGEPPFGEGEGAVVAVPPRGIGLSLTAGPARGSGYLLVLPDGYGGVLDIMLGPVKVTAFGLLRSSGADGMSFVAVMSVSFPVPIELGLLFTLNAVGGIVGLGVGIDPAAISSGLKDGVLDNLLFPEDVRKAAPTILQSLGRIFPAQRGGFVVGPMLRLGWGRPVTLVTLDVAVLLAVPDPVMIVLGRARSVIPDESVAIIDLRAAVMAQVGRGIVLVRAELYSSRIGFVSVYGGIGLLIRFGDDRTVVLSAGGFHPTYTRKPPELADLSRIGAEMSPPIGLQLRVQGYVALTPNTVQFGGAIEIAYSVGIAAVRGALTLDALIQFDPFGFEVDITASAHVEALGCALFGVSLALHLSGPSPWRVSGTGKVTLPWPLPDPSISFGPVQFGDAPAAPPPPPVRPLGLVADALRRPGAWQRIDRQGAPSPVRLAPLPDGALVLEPWGLMRTSQRLAPLDMTLERWGAASVEPAGCRLALAGAVRIGPEGPERTDADHSPVAETFGVGQFMSLTKDAQLAAPEFEERTGGVAIDPSDAAADAGVLRGFATSATMAYEDSWPGAPEKKSSGVGFFDLSGWARFVLDAGPAGATRLRVDDRYRADDLERRIAVRQVSETLVTDVRTGAVIAEFAPWTDAVHTASQSLGGLASMTKVVVS
ncbi:hypothetical protein B1729_07480 [Microbacterium sp. B35-04]|uniref:DUF6603 domain-containing protein n=1 Tax=Microbacterium sp. B35-04 TaxID=1961716 RepID=UPI0013D7FA0F|nr:DUF6603 domain-containing protein [Microbacterium sp. B35-04]KAF2413895.1 hypothetical protein B1729_07480 [Microbacterium sp. B35-04]